MKRAEFIEVYADTVARGRAKNFPEMRPSERAAARVHDLAKAVKIWKEVRSSYAPRTVEQLKADWEEVGI